MPRPVPQLATVVLASAIAVEAGSTQAIADAKEAKAALLEKFPAAEPQGHVAFFAARGEYDESGKLELRVASPGGRLRRWLFEESRVDKATGSLRTRVFPGAQRQARQLVSTNGYRSLSPGTACTRPESVEDPSPPQVCRCESATADDLILPTAAGPWLVSYDAARTEVRIRDADCTVVLRRKAAIPKGWYCCGGAEPSDPGCTVPWDRMVVWWDDNVLMIEGSSIAGPDTCGLDHVYLVVWPRTGKTIVSDNWNALQTRTRR